MVSGASPRVILAATWLALVACAYPGRMSGESFAYLRQARTRFFSDGHAPALSTLWRVLELVLGGPAGMLLAQGAMLVIGAYWILSRTLAPRPAAWATAAVVAFPPVLAPMTAIWSHSMMAGLLALGTGALLSGRRRAGLLALLGATAVQPSALAATLPLVVLLFVWRDVRRHAYAAAAWLAITAAALGINAVLAKQPTRAWHSALASYDLAGTLVFADADAGALVGTGVVVEPDPAAAVRAAYTPRGAASIARLWQLPADRAAPPAAQRDALAGAARALVLDHPAAYLRHRLGVFRELLWLGGHSPETVTAVEPPPRAEALAAGVPARHSTLQDAAAHGLTWLAARTPLFAPWSYLLLALLLAPLARRHRDLLALLASGVAFEASLLVTATGPELRHSHWMITSTVLTAILLAARRARG